jgi:type II secretory pathway predicted ATPase ExeA
MAISGDPLHVPAKAFALTPDPRALYMSPEHRDALAALRAGIESGRGLLVLVGAVGSGKTTLLHALLGEIGPDVRTAYVSDTLGSFTNFLRQVVADFGIAAADGDEAMLRAALRAFLLECQAKGVRAVLVVDEAQHLSDEQLEKLRLLSDLDTHARKLLQLVLVGPSTFAERLENPALHALRERVATYSWLGPLDAQESRRYIAHRIEVAGGTRSLFTAAATRLAARLGDGIPRRLNIICHDAVAAATAAGAKRVSARAVWRAASDRQAQMASGLRFSSRTAAAQRPLAAATAVLALAGMTVLLPKHGPQPDAHRSAEHRAGGGSAHPLTRPVVPVAVAHVSSPHPGEPRAARYQGPLTTEATSPVPAEDAQPSRALADELAERKIRVAPGKGLRALARDFYGSDAPRILQRIVRANPEITNIDRIRAGQTLRLPGPFHE